MIRTSLALVLAWLLVLAVDPVLADVQPLITPAIFQEVIRQGVGVVFGLVILFLWVGHQRRRDAADREWQAKLVQVVERSSGSLERSSGEMRELSRRQLEVETSLLHLAERIRDDREKAFTEFRTILDAVNNAAQRVADLLVDAK